MADQARNEVQIAPKCIIYRWFNVRLLLLVETQENPRKPK